LLKKIHKMECLEDSRVPVLYIGRTVPKVKCQHFGKHCLFHLHRRLGIKYIYIVYIHISNQQEFLPRQCYVKTHHLGLSTGRHTARPRTYLLYQRLPMQLSDS
jgi:hypothetical protein